MNSPAPDDRTAAFPPPARADLAALPAFPALGAVALNNNGDRITDAGLDHLARCRLLTSVHLQKTKVTEEGVKKLAGARPDLRIFWDGGTIEPKEPPKE